MRWPGVPKGPGIEIPDYTLLICNAQLHVQVHVQENYWNMQPTRPGQKTNSPNEASDENYEGKVEK